MNTVQILKKYFDIHPDGYKGLTGLQSFAAELKELSPADKHELATLAAAALGVVLED